MPGPSQPQLYLDKCIYAERETCGRFVGQVCFPLFSPLNNPIPPNYIIGYIIDVLAVAAEGGGGGGGGGGAESLL